ncbi:hypothetical protein BC567DRAFT_19658 [Phyllosticta citribraziliensis]
MLRRPPKEETTSKTWRWWIGWACTSPTTCLPMTERTPSGWLVGSSKGACRRSRRRRPKADARARAPPDQGAACLVRLPGVSRWRRRWWRRLFRVCYLACPLSLPLSVCFSFFLSPLCRESLHFPSTTNSFGDGCAWGWRSGVCGCAARQSCLAGSSLSVKMVEWLESSQVEASERSEPSRPILDRATGCCVLLLSGRLLQFLFGLGSGVDCEAPA